MENELTAIEAAPVMPPALHRKRRAVPRVRVYSRHADGCKLPIAQRKPTANGCACPKSLSYYRDGKLHNVSADTIDRHVAEDKARAMMNAFASAAKGEPTIAPTASGSFLIDDLVAQFVAKKTGDNIRRATVRQWSFELLNFAKFLRGRGLINIGDITSDDVQSWRDGLEGAPAGRRKRVMMIVSFFDYCVGRDKIRKSPAIRKDLKIKRDDVQEPKALDDAQFSKLLAALPNLNGRTTDEDRATLKSLAILMRMSGLAEKDAVTCRRDVFEQMPNGTYSMVLKRAKTKKPVHNYISAAAMAAILKGANPKGAFLFIDSLPTDEKELKNLVNKFHMRFTKLSKLADIRDENGEKIKAGSHCFGRHSFVLACLNADMTTSDIGIVIGDTAHVVEQHYSRWCAARAARLEQRMMSVIAKQPTNW